MSSEAVAEALRFKRELERDFAAAAGLPERAYFSATYSLPQTSPILWLNLNPGGTPTDHRVLSDDRLARGQHEFWDGDGKTSRATGAFIERAVKAPRDRLRSVQGTNVVWERSARGGDIDLRSSARRTAPFLLRYVRYVQPEVLIFGGAAAQDLFIDAAQARVVATDEVVMGNWGQSQARIFVSQMLDVPDFGGVRALTVSHPSRGVRGGVIERCRSCLESIVLPIVVTA